MWTDESKEAELVAEVVGEQSARALLFQARVNIELYKHSCLELHQSLKKLEFHNFAGAYDTCHMNSGVLGSNIHASNKITYAQRVLAFLLSSMTSGHRLVKCLRAARNIDKGTEWGSVRKEISLLEESYRRVRNVLEHLPDAISKQEAISNTDIGFTPSGVFNAKDKNGEFTFDFSESSLQRPIDLYENIFAFLESRKK